MKKQTIDNQIGEIKFKERLIEKQIEGKDSIKDEYDAEGINGILKNRMDETLSDMKLLKKNGIPLSPYLEIGAERCQRAMIMENDMGESGAGADLAFHILKTGDHYKKVFGKKKIPMRICCDAYNLPFRTGSVPFIYTYQTLHHFPEPDPIIEEIYRVLSPGGNFFIGEEPYRQVLHFNLYKSDKMYSNKSLKKKNIIKKIMEKFFAEKLCNETDFNIIENHDISLHDWRKSLEMFSRRNIDLLSLKINSELYHPKSYAKYFASYLLGGSISGTCGKDGENTRGIKAIQEALICPECRPRKGIETALKKEKNLLSCPACRRKFPVTDGILFLFEKHKMMELYPEIEKKIKK